MAPQIWLHNFMQPPIFWCTKRYDPHPTCNSPQPPPPPPRPPLINDRSLILRMIISYLNHFVFHHYTICIFCVLFDMIVVTAAHSFVPQ